MALQSAEIEALAALPARTERPGTAPCACSRWGASCLTRTSGACWRRSPRPGSSPVRPSSSCAAVALESELRSTARRLAVPAHIEGPVAPAGLPAVYAEADVLALVSTYEPFGATVREGAAAGLPIICSERAGPPAISR